MVQFLLVRDRRRLFHFASLQSATGRAMVLRSGAVPDDLTTFYVVANHRTPDAKVLTKSRAVLFVAGALEWPWKAAGVAGILPTPVLDRLYEVVARHRYRVFGRLEQCLVPRPEDRHRFVDF